jgi:hypothetical protein
MECRPEQRGGLFPVGDPNQSKLQVMAQFEIVGMKRPTDNLVGHRKEKESGNG